MVVVFLILIFALAQIFLSDALSDRGAALDRLTRQVDELGQLLDLERGANADLRLSVAQLSAELQSSLAVRESLSTQLGSLVDRNEVLLSEREALDRRLAAIRDKLATATNSRDDAFTEAEQVRAELVDAFTVISADKETIELQLRNLESLRRDISALGQVREELERQVADLGALSRDQATQIANLGTEGQQLRDRSKALEARLADEQERTSLAQRELAVRDIRLAELLQRAEGLEAVYSEAEAADHPAEQPALAAAHPNRRAERNPRGHRVEERGAADADRRTWAGGSIRPWRHGVQELAEYRSEFFGRLRQVLGERDDIRIVGDRFVFQSEVLFRTAAAELESRGPRSAGPVRRHSARTFVVHSRRHRLGPARRRPHRCSPDPHRRVPVELGAIVGPRAVGRALLGTTRESPPTGWSPPASVSSIHWTSASTRKAYRRNRRIEFKADAEVAATGASGFASPWPNCKAASRA